MSKMFEVARIPATFPTLEVEVKGASVSFRHEDRNNILVKANNPGNWSVNGGTVRQTNVEAGANMVISSGDIITGGSTSIINMRSGGGRSVSSIIVNGVSIQIEDGVVYVNGKKQMNEPEQRVSCGWFRGLFAGWFRSRSNGNSVNGRQIEVSGRDVYVDGKKQVDASDDGATAPGDATPKSNGPDEIEIVLPVSLRAGLNLGYQGTSDINFDGWNGGNVSISASGVGDLKASGRFANVGKLSLNTSGTGDCTFQDIDCLSFAASRSGSGELFIEFLDSSESFDLIQTGTGNTRICKGYGYGGATNTGSGNISLCGHFNLIRQHNTGTGCLDNTLPSYASE
jgi:hypothetical protein